MFQILPYAVLSTALLATPGAPGQRNQSEQSIQPDSVAVAPEPSLPDGTLGPSMQNMWGAQKEEASCLLKALTPITVQIMASVDSEIAEAGEAFPITLEQPVSLGKDRYLSSGWLGQGVVVHAAKKGRGVKPGELVLAAQYLEVQRHRIPLRSFSLASLTGRREGPEVSRITVTPNVVTISSGRAWPVTVPAGSIATAKIARDTAIPCSFAMQKVVPDAAPISSNAEPTAREESR